MLKKRIASFVYAGRGVVTLLKTQTNAKIHLLATMLVISCGFAFRVTKTEWCLLTLSVGLVLAAEALNTAIEFAVDLASPEQHELAKNAKDVAAGGALLSAIAAAVVALFIFGPHFWTLLSP